MKNLRSWFGYLFAFLLLVGISWHEQIRNGIAQGFAPPVAYFNGSPSAPSISGQDGVSGFYFRTGNVGISRHVETGTSSIPVLSACGTTPTLATGSSDLGGTITLGTTATGCVITFGTAFVAAPGCLVTWRATPLASQSYTTSTTALTLTQTSTSNNLIDYWCTAKQGG